MLAELVAVGLDERETASASSSMRFIDPTKEMPMTLEDALGRYLRIPPEWLEFLHWNVGLLSPVLPSTDPQLLSRSKSCDIDPSFTTQGSGFGAKRVLNGLQ
jgi:hypothetical protein